MADDGMLMNFATELDPFRPKPVFKGGRWRDRLQAKKGLRRREQSKIQPHGSLTGPNTQAPTKTRQFGLEAERKHAEKRRKISDSNTASQQNNRTKTNHPKPKDGGGDIISSLFTSNPSSTLNPPPTQPPTDTLPTPVPSNAPLPPALHNFTSLGLSLPLSAHLNRTLSLTAPTAIQKAALPQLLGEETDAFIQAETGSGKTLAYLLPIIQRILSLTTFTTPTTTNQSSQASPINRSSGLFALILAPTRELTHQIYAVLSQLLSKYPNIVAGRVTGGSTKNHEKARLRKGLNILVATPGRLVDHLENTAVLDLGRVRWLVLDEGDRLMEMGFEEEVRKVVQAVDGQTMMKKKKNKKVGEGPEVEVRGLPARRTTVLCSATMKMGVQRLGEMSLKDAVLIKVDVADDTRAVAASVTEGGISDEPILTKTFAATNTTTSSDEHQKAESPSESPKRSTPLDKKDAPFRPPAQLTQSYILTPPKQRLVTLAALLHRTFITPNPNPVRKALVFLSCADSVDFHYEILTRMTPQPQPASASTPSAAAKEAGAEAEAEGKASTVQPSISPFTIPSIHKLHGSLPAPTRAANLTTFRTAAPPSILLTTDVSARGLDMPDIDLVIEYDSAFSMDEHLHRVGRTARAGREGRGMVLLMPGEEGYVDLLKGVSGDGGGGHVEGEGAEAILEKGFGSGKMSLGVAAEESAVPQKPSDNVHRNSSHQRSKVGWEQQATEWQLDVERWVLESPRVAELARKAFKSFVRAYATHVSAERGVFDVKKLHLGHLAKAFGLREKPRSMGQGGGGRREKEAGRRARRPAQGGDGVGGTGGTEKRIKTVDRDGPSSDGLDAVRKMRMKVKEHMAGGAGEFNIG